MEYFPNPECVSVVVRNSLDQSDSLPVYLVPSVSIVNSLEETKSLTTNEPVCLKIADFGNCEFATSTPLIAHTNISSIWRRR